MITNEVLKRFEDKPDDAFTIRHKKLYEELLKVADSTIKMTVRVRTMNDERVRPECKIHQNIKIDVIDGVIGKNLPPFHDKCRCIPIYEFNFK